MVKVLRPLLVKLMHSVKPILVPLKVVILLPLVIIWTSDFNNLHKICYLMNNEI